MNIIRLTMVLVALAAAGALTPHATAQDGVALAIIFDTSGSMKDPVLDKAGTPTPKYIVANHALIAVARQISAFVTNNVSGEPRKIDVALFVFQGEHAREVVKMGPFQAEPLERFARQFATPSGNTPLGNSLTAAGRSVLESPLPRKHVLIITDGMNTAGPPPASVLPGLKKQADQKGTNLGVHFIAFDVAAKLFDPVKRLGATVVAAADENQLNSQLQFILQRKILLEEEEPPKQK